MVSRKDLLRKGKRAFDEITRLTPTNEEIRRLLPLSRGGSPRSKVSSASSGQATPIPTTQLPTLTYGDSPGNIARQFQQSAQFRATGDRQMTTQDTIRDMINDPMITITEDMIPIINDPGVIMDAMGNLFANQFSREVLLQDQPKKKKKVSKYQKELGRQLKMLKKKHPRTAVTALMKRAHRLTRKALSK